MTLTIETVKLSETVGAEVRGVDVDRLLGDEDLGVACARRVGVRRLSRRHMCRTPPR